MILNILSLFLIMALQLALVYRWQLLGVVPNLVLIFLLFTLWQKEGKRTYFVSKRRLDYIIRDYRLFFLSIIIVGLFWDFFSGLPLGTIIFSLVLSFLLVYLFLHSLLSDFNLTVLIILVVFITVLYNLAMIVWLSSLQLLGLYGGGYHLNFSWLRSVLLEVVYNLVVSVLIFYVFRRFRKLFY